MNQPFKTDIEAIKKRAREKMLEGAVTAGYRKDPQQVIQVLNEVLATETVCTLRYKNHYYMATGIHAESVAKEFLEHAREEQVHADRVAARIAELGGNPNLDPKGLHARSHADYNESDDLLEMIRENLVAERIAIETYSEIIRWLGEDDSTTRRLIEEILEQEEEHADDMKKFLERLDRNGLH
jgi:bacterioferritin